MDNFSEKFSRRAVLGGALVAATIATAGETKVQRSKKKPNFIFILADDLGAFDLSCYGRPDYRTPHIDSLARDGMKFNRGYANSSTCAPTRVGLISGRYQHRLPIGTGFGGGYPSDKIGYPGDLPSLANVLKPAGYRTALIGKWDLGELPTFSPNKSGYDEFFGLMGGAFDYWSHEAQNLFDPTDHSADLYENEQPVKVDGYATDLFSKRACDYIERNASGPFMLSLHYTAPHWPWQTRAGPGQTRLSDADFEGGSPTIYAEMMAAMDDGVGQILATLRKHDLTRDTLVIFTSDNGGERFSKMWPLRGEKGDLWEGGTRVPLIACWPGRIKRGTVSNQVAMSMDFLPTFAALAGIPTNPAYPPDGIDLSPHFLGEPVQNRTVFWKTPYDMLSALAYPWKYLRRGKHEYLFNLDEDPTERANLKRRKPEIFAKLQVEARTWGATMLPNMPDLPKGYVDYGESLTPLPMPPEK